MRILLADDDTPTLEMLTLLLTKRGHVVTAVIDGAAAWNEYKERPFPFILTDWMMPGIDGLELCHNVRSHPEGTNTLICVCTARCDSEALRAVIAAGADDYITKPVVPEVFGVRISIAEERVRLRALRRSTDEALKETQARLEHVLSCSPTGIYTLNLAGDRFTWVSSSFTQMIGCDSAAVLEPGWWRLRIHPEDRERVEKELMTLGSAKTLSQEYRVQSGSGAYQWIRDTKRLLFHADGSPIEIIGSWIDVTDRVQTEEHMRQTLKLEAIGKLAGGVAHEFNNMLTVIIGRSQLMLSRLKAGDKFHYDAELIQNTGERAARLTRQLLQFSRQHVQQPKRINLNVVLHDLEKLIRRMIGQHIELAMVLEPGLGTIDADPGQIEQSIMTLILNARDAMPAGGKLLIESSNVEIDAGYAMRHVGVKPGSYARITFTDSGAGMDEHIRSRIFDPFFTTKEQGKGTGLGLSTVYGIIKQSGGNIWVYSELGIGTTFKVYLPLANEPEQLHPLDRSTFAAPSRTETILLVDDEPDVRDLIHEVLNELGYRLLVAGSGAEAVKVCAQHNGPIHLMITDVVMPMMSGKEAADQIRQSRPEMKILFMSGYPSDTVVHNGVLEKDLAFLEKPFTSESLARQINKVLSRY